MVASTRGRLLARPLLLSCALALLNSAQSGSQTPPAGETVGVLNWQSSGRLCQRPRSQRGELVVREQHIEFHPAKGSALRWSFMEIKTVSLLTPRRLVLTSYENHTWHRPGNRSFRFKLDSPMPSIVAAKLVQRVGKPAINGDPNPRSPSFATLLARHRTRTGGSNGLLRFREDGIDYVTSHGQDSRSWRWADVRTLANANPYELQLDGYLETFEFELKQPLSSELFDRLWDHLYARDLNVEHTPGGHSDAD